MSLARSLGRLDWSLTVAGGAGAQNRALSESPEAWTCLPPGLGASRAACRLQLGGECRTWQDLQECKQECLPGVHWAKSVAVPAALPTDCSWEGLSLA